MPTTEEIFNEFKEIIKSIDNYDLRNKLGKVVLDSVHKHRDNDLEIERLKLNMEAQKKLFLTNLENLEDRKCSLKH